MRAARSVGSCALIALAASFGTAAAQDLAVFGIPLGAEFEITECEKAVVGNITVYQAATATCFERLGSQDTVRDTTRVENGSVLIRYPGTDAPTVMSGGTAVGLVRGRILQGIRFNTRGVDVQDQVLAALTEKFGKPGSVAPKQVQNTLGSTFDVFDARWALPQAEIVFRSVASRIDTGFLGIDLKQTGDPQPRAPGGQETSGEPGRN